MSLKALRQRHGVWYLDNSIIINGQEIDDLDYALVSEYEEKLYYSDLDRLIMMESIDEMVNEISNTYCCFFRFYDKFKTDTRTIWISHDKMVPYFSDRYEGCFLGEWREDDWSSMRREIRKLCSRKFVVRREWIGRVAEGLSGKRLMKQFDWQGKEC